MPIMLENDIDEILRWLPKESHDKVREVWKKNKKLGVVHITQYMPFTTVCMTVAWCYTKAMIDSFSLFSSSDLSGIKIYSKSSLMAIRYIYGDSKKHVEFVDKYIKNKLKNFLRGNSLYYDFEIDDIFTEEPEIAIIEDESSKMAIIRLTRSYVVFVFKSGYRFSWIPDSMPLNFQSVKWTLNKDFACIKDAEKYNLLEEI